VTVATPPCVEATDTTYFSWHFAGVFGDGHLAFAGQRHCDNHSFPRGPDTALYFRDP